MIQEAIARVIEGRDLDTGQMTAVMEEITGGEATPAQIASFITALRIKGETTDEIAAAARVMREKATPIVVDPAGPGLLVDTCGTGGDQRHTFNVSTAAAFVVAGAGLRVAKHGNRSVSSSCGSADVLEALGVDLSLPPDRVGACIREVGIGFLFAPMLHGTMKHAIGPRREIGIRTIFNVLGPLTNPAGAQVQVMGVYDKGLTARLAEVLGKLGSRRALVVHGEDGTDEITLTGKTHVAEWNGGQVRTYTIEPGAFGLPPCRLEDLRGASADENRGLLLEVLDGKEGPKRDVVLLNAGAALYAASAAADIAEGIELARRAIDEGKAREKLDALVAYSTGAGTAS